VELEISHSTRYAFSQPVFLEPHVLRFQPRADGSQTPLEFEMDINPEPAGKSICLDAAGNTVTHAWFEGLHERLAIDMRAVVRTSRENPFDFLLDHSRTMLPVAYEADAALLRPYLLHQRGGDGEPEAAALAAFAARMRDAARHELAPMLTSLNHTLYERFALIRRGEGEAWPAARTWREGRGACRDLAVLFVDVCRALGVAARFVSGYEEPCPAADSCDLHAWAEVYIPGGGWRGYDPSRGLAVAQHHVAVAAAASPADAAPVIGTFRGAGATSRIEADVRVERRCHALAP
jgi:transglutaminase-like putative cysteine protease